MKTYATTSTRSDVKSFGDIGFTANLRTELMKSHEQIDEWLDQTMIQVDRKVCNAKQQLQVSQRDIDKAYADLMALQIGEQSSPSESKENTDSKLPLLEIVRNLDEEKDRILSTLEQKKQKVQGMCII